VTSDESQDYDEVATNEELTRWIENRNRNVITFALEKSRKTKRSTTRGKVQYMTYPLIKFYARLFSTSALSSPCKFAKDKKAAGLCSSAQNNNGVSSTI